MNKQLKTKNGVVIGRGIEWKEIPGFDGYLATTDGLIYSGWYPTKNGRVYNGTKLKTLKSKPRKSDGYHKLTLVDKDGKHIDMYVHQLIAITFIGECPEGLEVCHKNGNKSDNRLDNLKYGTRFDNAQDKVTHGTSTRGENHNTAKLTPQQVWIIRSRIEAGETDAAISRDFGVVRSAIYAIRKGTSWGWLNE